MYKNEVATDKATIMLTLAAILVITGRWARGQKFDWKIAPALIVVVILVTVLKEFSPELGDGFAAIAFVSALLTYGRDTLKHFSGSNTSLGGGAGHATLR